MRKQGNIEHDLKTKNERANSFIEKASELHNNEYSYELVDYTNAHTKVKIICKEHGIFEQKPYAHIGLNKSGCPKCGKISSTNKGKKTLEQFILEANELHNFKYTYDKTIYVTNKIDIIVTCPHHGDFITNPNRHLSQKNGCNKCTMSKGEEKVIKILYKFGINFNYDHVFDDCIYKKRLRFDFYLTDFNTCIEYDGQQHYDDVNFFDNDLSINKIRDNIKNEYCIKNNIKLIRISYLDYESIYDILDLELHDIKNLENSIDFKGIYRKYKSYEESKIIMLSKYSHVKSQTMFNNWKYSDEYDLDVPKDPYIVYKASGEWISWGDFLNSGNEYMPKCAENYVSYEEAKKWVYENLDTSKLSISIWKTMHRNGEIPNFIPRYPITFYKRLNRGWISYVDFFGKEKSPN